MALQISFLDASGVNHPEAYYRVVKINADWGKEYGLVVVDGHHTKNARDANLEPVDTIAITARDAEFQSLFGFDTLSEENNNPVASTYAYLKTLPKFADAIDV